MASACVNNMGMSPENFPSKTYQSYGWLSPRISFSREEDSNNTTTSKTTTTTKSSSSAAAAGAASSAPLPPPHPQPCSDPPEALDSVDFEFRLDNSFTMLPADELFSDGKLMPLQVNTGNAKPSLPPSTSTSVDTLTEAVRLPETGREPVRSCRRLDLEISGTDPYLFSPKAPRCSSRWKELLGLRKLHQNPKPETQKPSTRTALFSSTSSNPKSLKHFLHRNSKTCNCNISSSTSSSSSYTLLDHSLSLPLLRDLDCESLSISSRLSLSSSSSSHEHEDLPRLSLDSDKPSTNLNPMQNPDPNPFIINRNQNQNPPRMRMVKPIPENGNNNNGSSSRVGRSPMRRAAGESSEVSISSGVSVDSPRLNSSGKIVFQSLERSSSSPSSFNGGPRYKHRGMERSYSANVRVTPVLNVPVCSLRGSSKSGFGFGQLFSSSPQKRDGFSKVYQQQNTTSTSSRKQV
ncbi:serine-rich protein [Salix suchowensis]|nr:serine-rich protein [Salix suchowensis]